MKLRTRKPQHEIRPPGRQVGRYREVWAEIDQLDAIPEGSAVPKGYLVQAVEFGSNEKALDFRKALSTRSSTQRKNGFRFTCTLPDDSHTIEVTRWACEVPEVVETEDTEEDQEEVEIS